MGTLKLEIMLNEELSKRIREKSPVLFKGRNKETWGYDITGGNFTPIFHDVEDDMLLINHKEGFKPNQSEIKQYGLKASHKSVRQSEVEEGVFESQTINVYNRFMWVFINEIQL